MCRSGWLTPSRFAAKDYMERWINPPGVMEAEEKARRDAAAKVRHATPVKPTRDVLLYLLEHARMDRSVSTWRDGQVVWITPAEIFARYGLDEFGRPVS